MQTSAKALGIVLILSALAGCAHELKQTAQSNLADHRWHSPIIDALDVNHDGIIDSNEIANAAVALWTLDKTKKGYLSYEDIHYPNQREHEGEPEPAIAVLDANHDDIIDSNEIANAPIALKKLDKNGDGQLTPDEYTPQYAIGLGGASKPQNRDTGGHSHHRGQHNSSQTPPATEQP